MHLTTLIFAIPTLFSSATTAAPFPLVAEESCIPQDDRFPVAEFQSWITMCGQEAGYTKGSNRVYPSHARDKLCLPLPDDIRGLEISELKEGCVLTAYSSPVCDEWVPNAYVASRPATGCLWAGNREFHSYRVDCGE